MKTNLGKGVLWANKKEGWNVGFSEKNRIATSFAWEKYNKSYLWWGSFKATSPYLDIQPGVEKVIGHPPL